MFHITHNDVVNMLHTFYHMCVTIKKTLISKTKEMYLTLDILMALHTLIYLFENWTFTKCLASRIQVAKLRFLRHVAGYSLQDQRRNVNIIIIIMYYIILYVYKTKKEYYDYTLYYDVSATS